MNISTAYTYRLTSQATTPARTLMPEHEEPVDQRSTFRQMTDENLKSPKLALRLSGHVTDLALRAKVIREGSKASDLLGLSAAFVAGGVGAVGAIGLGIQGGAVLGSALGASAPTGAMIGLVAGVVEEMTVGVGALTGATLGATVGSNLGAAIHWALG